MHCGYLIGCQAASLAFDVAPVCFLELTAKRIGCVAGVRQVYHLIHGLGLLGTMIERVPFGKLGRIAFYRIIELVEQDGPDTRSHRVPVASRRLKERSNGFDLISF